MTLSAEEVAWIKANRSEITGGNTEQVTLIHLVPGEPDPYTNEPTGTTEDPETVDAVWKVYVAVSEEDRVLVSGVEIRQGDVRMTVDNSVTLSDVDTVRHNGDDYTVITVDPKGLGGVNRYECLVRQAV
jgi:ABC-type histidine transport system ATPase subunit